MKSKLRVQSRISTAPQPVKALVSGAGYGFGEAGPVPVEKPTPASVSTGALRIGLGIAADLTVHAASAAVFASANDRAATATTSERFIRRPPREPQRIRQRATDTGAEAPFIWA